MSALLRALLLVLELLLNAWNRDQERNPMEVGPLARLVVLLVAALKDEGMLTKNADPGHDAIVDEIEALTQVHAERARAQLAYAPGSPRGDAARERAADPEKSRTVADNLYAPPKE